MLIPTGPNSVLLICGTEDSAVLARSIFGPRFKCVSTDFALGKPNEKFDLVVVMSEAYAKEAYIYDINRWDIWRRSLIAWARDPARVVWMA